MAFGLRLVRHFFQFFLCYRLVQVVLVCCLPSGCIVGPTLKLMRNTRWVRWWLLCLVWMVPCAGVSSHCSGFEVGLAVNSLARLAHAKYGLDASVTLNLGADEGLS
jgi:hypothetical protein